MHARIVMSGWKKSFTAATLGLSVPLFSSGSFAKVFASALVKPALQKVSAQAEPGGVQWSAAENSRDAVVPASYDDTTGKSLDAIASVTTQMRHAVFGGIFLSALIVPKVSRYLAKSVLIL